MRLFKAVLLMMSNNDKPPQKMKDALRCTLEARIRQEEATALNYCESRCYISIFNVQKTCVPPHLEISLLHYKRDQ